MLLSSVTLAEESGGFGFIYDRFPLTSQADGWREEAAGPFYYHQTADGDTTWGIPPFFSSDRDTTIGSYEYDILYPALTYTRYGDEARWQLGQVFSFSGGQEAAGENTRRRTVFPFYFQQRSADTNLDYTAFVPFYGHLQNRLFRDDIYFVMFPFYSETRKRDLITDNYLYPFVARTHGPGLSGWQVWPLAGQEHKTVTTSTNGFGEIELVPGHDSSFILWPFHLSQDTGVGSDNPETLRATLPFYALNRSAPRDSTSVFWPFFTWIDERGKHYREWQGPWPFVIFSRGEGKTTSRVWPLFSQSHNAVKESDSYLWPLYQYRRLHADPLDQRRTRVLFYLFGNTVERNTQTGLEQRRVDMWPFFTWHREFNGNERLQVLALMECVLPDNRGMVRNWAPLWSWWRQESNPRSGAASQSLLWNLYRRDTAPQHKKISLLFGLFQYQCAEAFSRTRLFYFTVSQTPPAGK